MQSWYGSGRRPEGAEGTVETKVPSSKN
eukprot:COSAG06_NODE_17814_length_920_cov_0.853837_1_plen_27_part_01